MGGGGFLFTTAAGADLCSPSSRLGIVLMVVSDAASVCITSAITGERDGCGVTDGVRRCEMACVDPSAPSKGCGGGAGISAYNRKR